MYNLHRMHFQKDLLHLKDISKSSISLESISIQFMTELSTKKSVNFPGQLGGKNIILVNEISSKIETI